MNTHIIDKKNQRSRNDQMADQYRYIFWHMPDTRQRLQKNQPYISGY